MTYKHSDLWPIVYDALQSKFDIVAWIDVLKEDVDILPKKLYQRLLPWADGKLDYNQRIIIYHRDVEYYFESGSSGFFIQNLYRIFNYLNVPSEFIIILHSNYDIGAESKKLAKQFNVPAMQTIYCPYQWCPLPQDVKPVDLNVNSIQKPFACLNGVPRIHRMYTLAMMKELDILDSGMTSLWIEPNNQATSNELVKPDIKLPNDLHLCMLDNPTRINETLVYNKIQQNVIITWFGTLDCHCSPLIVGGPNQEDSRYQPGFLQSALWNVITETVGEYPYAFFTEKTWKAILTKRPFILLGGKGSLHQLKCLGFKTFDTWIDESYDEEIYFTDRADRALAELKQFCNYSQNQLQDVVQEMQEILDYNFNHYIHSFGGTMVDNFIKTRL
jgi:hypothetical protein